MIAGLPKYVNVQRVFEINRCLRIVYNKLFEVLIKTTLGYTRVTQIVYISEFSILGAYI